MKKPYLIFIVALMIIFSIHSHLLSSSVLASIQGTLISEDKKPIEGAKVILISSEDGTKYEITTDKKGKWRKVNLFPGAWTIGFMAEGFQPKDITVTLSAVRENPPIEVKLTRLPESPFSYGDELYKQAKYAEALQEYQIVLAYHQELTQAYGKIGLCYYRLNEYDKAIEAFKKALDKEPLVPDILINLSAIYFEKGNLEEGLKYFKLLDENTLKDPGLFYNVGILLFKNNQIDLAADYLKKCLKLDPKFIDGYYQLGLVSLNKGDLEEARTNFMKIIEISPESEKAAMAKKILEGIK